MVSPRNIRLALAILVVTATIGIVAAISLKGSKSAPPVPVSQQLPHNIDVALNNARFTEMREGKVVWELVADRTAYDKNGDRAYLSGIRMEFAKTGSAGTIVVTAATGEYSISSRNVKLRGRVRVVTEDGAIFETEYLEYLAARSRFTSMKPVNFHHQRLKLTATGMDLDVKDHTARFHQPVEATVNGGQLR
jgi:LPS export ABC transporter protein LptC